MWISPIAGKSFFPYAAYVERLTATEMTIALLSKTPDDLRQRPPESLRHKLTWNGRSFEGKTENLLGITGGITLGVAISASGEAMGLSFANDREAHILGCLISSKHY